jgi:hypothetical protein
MFWIFTSIEPDADRDAKPPASAWRQQPLTPAKRRSEALQFALSVVTLVLLFAEWFAHYRLKGTL